MQLRPFNIEDAPIILSWCKTKEEFRKWSADRYPDFPTTPQLMAQQYAPDNIFPLTAVDEDGRIIGHIMLRRPDPQRPSLIRVGFVIVDNQLRGKGYGKQLVTLALEYAKQQLGAEKISLGVFLNNPSAKNCYESVGFVPVGEVSYPIDGQDWPELEMIYQEGITYSDTHDFKREDLEELFLSVDWSSGHYPDHLVKAMKNYETVFSAWDGNKLVGLASVMDDGIMTAYVHYLLVNPEYHKKGIGKALVYLVKNHYKDYLRIALVSYNKECGFYESCGFKKDTTETPMYITSLWT